MSAWISLIPVSPALLLLLLSDRERRYDSRRGGGDTPSRAAGFSQYIKESIKIPLPPPVLLPLQYWRKKTAFSLHQVGRILRTTVVVVSPDAEERRWEPDSPQGGGFVRRVQVESCRRSNNNYAHAGQSGEPCCAASSGLSGRIISTWVVDETGRVAAVWMASLIDRSTGPCSLALLIAVGPCLICHRSWTPCGEAFLNGERENENHPCAGEETHLLVMQLIVPPYSYGYLLPTYTLSVRSNADYYCGIGPRGLVGSTGHELPTACSSRDDESIQTTVHIIAHNVTYVYTHIQKNRELDRLSTVLPVH